MKEKLLILFLLFSNACISNNWELFPLDQRTNYSYSLNSEDHILAFSVDSVLSSPTGDFLLFNVKDPLYNSLCNMDSLKDHFWVPQASPFYFDSLLNRNDTVFMYSSETSLPFYFIPGIGIGQSWTISSDYPLNDYSDITITCDSIVVTTVFGVSDSVKYFSMIPNGSSTNQVPVSNFNVRLSKTFGLLEYVPFFRFLIHPSGTDFFTMTMIGFKNDVLTKGFVQPQFEDYFHLSAGDILFWKHLMTSPGPPFQDVLEFYRDSIITSTINSDSVVYVVDRYVEVAPGSIVHQPNTLLTYRKSDFTSLLSALPEGYAKGAFNFSNGSITTNDQKWYYYANRLESFQDTISGDSITQFGLGTYGYWLDEPNCALVFTADFGYDFNVNTKVGFYSYCETAWGPNCFTLTGYRIDGIQAGNITLGVNDIHISKNALNIYPVPVLDILHINANYGNHDVAIFDCVGKLVQRSWLNNGEVNVEALASGVYQLRIIDEGKVLSAKFVKQ